MHLLFTPKKMKTESGEGLKRGRAGCKEIPVSGGRNKDCEGGRLATYWGYLWGWEDARHAAD